MSIEIIEEVPGGAPETRREVRHIPGGDPHRRPPRQSDPGVPDFIEERRWQHVRASIADMEDVTVWSAGHESKFVPNIPDFLQQRRSGELITGNSPDQFVPTPPSGIGRRAQAIVPLGEDVMMLEAFLLEESQYEEGYVRVVGLGDCGPSQGMEKLITDRRHAVAKTNVCTAELQDRVNKLDRLITHAYGPMLVQAKKQRDHRRAGAIAAKIAKADLFRAASAAMLVRSVKAADVGAVLVKNARTQQNLLMLANLAAQKGLAADAKVLQAGAKEVAANSTMFKALQKKQVRNTGIAKAASTLKAAGILLRQTERDHRRDVSVVVPPVAQRDHRKKLAMQRIMIAKLGAKVQGERRKLVAAGIPEVELEDEIARDGMRAEAVVGVLYGLGLPIEASFQAVDGLFDSISNGLKSIGGKVKGAIKDAGNAAVNALKKGACALASNPAILKAATAAGASVAGTFVGGPVGTAAGAKGGAMAAEVANGLLKSACPAGAPMKAQVRNWRTPGGQVAQEVTVVPVEAKKSAIVPVVAAGGAAALLLLLL